MLFFRPDNKTVLSALSAVALLVTVISRRRENTAYVNLLVLTGCAAVYCFRAANGAFLLPLLYEDSALSKGILEARVAFVIISIILINALIDFVKNDVIKVTNSSRDSVKLQTGSKLAMLFHGMKNAWIVLMVLLMRPHNVTLVMMTCLQEMCIRVCLIRLKSSFSTTSLTLLYLWMGQATFFYQVKTFFVKKGQNDKLEIWPQRSSTSLPYTTRGGVALFIGGGG